MGQRILLDQHQATLTYDYQSCDLYVFASIVVRKWKQKSIKMLQFFQRILDWFKSLFWKEEMELTLVGLQYSGKTTFVNVIAVNKITFSPPTNSCQLIFLFCVSDFCLVISYNEDWAYLLRWIKGPVYTHFVLYVNIFILMCCVWNFVVIINDFMHTFTSQVICTRCLLELKQSAVEVCLS